MTGFLYLYLTNNFPNDFSTDNLNPLPPFNRDFLKKAKVDKSMAEFELLAEHFSRHNSKFRPLYDALVSEENRCISELRDRKRVYHYDSRSEEELEKHCRKARKGFDRFLEREKTAYKQVKSFLGFEQAFPKERDGVLPQKPGK